MHDLYEAPEGFINTETRSWREFSRRNENFEALIIRQEVTIYFHLPKSVKEKKGETVAAHGIKTIRKSKNLIMVLDREKKQSISIKNEMVQKENWTYLQIISNR